MAALPNTVDTTCPECGDTITLPITLRPAPERCDDTHMRMDVIPDTEPALEHYRTKHTEKVSN